MGKCEVRNVTLKADFLINIESLSLKVILT